MHQLLVATIMIFAFCITTSWWRDIISTNGKLS